MTRTELPWLLFGRLVRPFPLAASIASVDLALLIAGDQSVWGDSADYWSQAVAWIALVSALLLWWAWWGRSTLAMQHGLMGVVVVFTARGVYIGLAGGNWWTGALSFCWALAAAGAWLLERTTGHLDGGRAPGRGRYE